MHKTILVTGGAGFVGSHLCERLAKDGHRVISLDNYFTGSKENHVADVEYREGHTKHIAELVTEPIDVVFHLGEYSRVEKSFEDIELVWDLNKTGTFAVLEFCRRQDCKLVYAGSSTKFADGGTGSNQSPYAWMKSTNTELVKNYADWFGLQYAITYFYNVYGPREMSDSYGTLIGIFSQLYRQGQPLTVTAPGTQERNFTHVDDIVAGLVLVGERGKGDGFGIGSDQAYSVLAVAKLFGEDVVMMPERKGNRLASPVESDRTKALGWSASRQLSQYIQVFKTEVGDILKQEQRILVYSTTFLPDAGGAELALYDLMKSMPKVKFDVITTKFSPAGAETTCDLPNVTLHRIGKGRVVDKYWLPLLGASIARSLQAEHTYLFQWSLFASYAALAAILSRPKKKLPLLITLADQKLGSIPWYLQIFLRHILGRADQVYATDTREASAAISLSKRRQLIRSIGHGDAFANQIRFVYSNFLQKHTIKNKTL